jgi:pimeloyl-ACP methyl ester carboxylesterase
MNTESQEVTVRGIRLHVRHEGQGPPLLLIHGFLVDHTEWDEVIDLLKRDFRCIAPDLPGAGRSDRPSREQFGYTREAFADLLAELITTLGYESAHVGGHSMGGAVALALAADYPQQVRKLVVVDPECYPFALPWKARVPLIPKLGGFVFKHLYGKRMFVDYFREQVQSRYRPLNVPKIESYYAKFDDPVTRDLAHHTLGHILDFRGMRDKIERVQAPSLVVWGAEDAMLPVAMADRLTQELRRARMVVIPRCGHAPNEETPAELAHAIRAHLQADEPATPTR